MNKDMEYIKSMKVLLNNKYEANFSLDINEDENGEIYGILTVPYVEWVTPETSFVNYRELTIKDRELECIEKTYFDNSICEIPVQGYPYPVEMCDFLYKIIPAKIYDQLASGTFKVNKDADPKIYSTFLNRDKENKSTIRKFINNQKKLGFTVNSKSILYARELDVPTSTKEKLTITLVDKLSEDGKYKIQIHKTNPGAETDKKTLKQREFDDLYEAKKAFDAAEYSEFC
jgi:hypothetical protein